MPGPLFQRKISQKSPSPRVLNRIIVIHVFHLNFRLETNILPEITLIVILVAGDGFHKIIIQQVTISCNCQTSLQLFHDLLTIRGQRSALFPSRVNISHQMRTGTQVTDDSHHQKHTHVLHSIPPLGTMTYPGR